MITSERIVVRMFFATIAERDHMLWRCAEPHHNRPQVTLYAFIVVVPDHTSGKCHSKPNDNREEPRSTPRDLRDQGPRINYSRMGQPQVSHHQTRFNEGLNRQYSPNYINPYQSMLGSIPGQDLSALL